MASSGILGKVRSICEAAEVASATLDYKDRQALVDKLFDLRCEVGDLVDENRELKAENARLSEELARRKALEYRDGLYYVIEGRALVGPVCPSCYEGTGLIHLLKNGSNGWRCVTCGNRYNDGKPAGGYTLWN